jgi:hypothetical protein
VRESFSPHRPCPSVARFTLWGGYILNDPRYHTMTPPGCKQASHQRIKQRTRTHEGITCAYKKPLKQKAYKNKKVLDNVKCA